MGSCPHHSRDPHRTREREKTPQAPVLAAILPAPMLQKVTGKHHPLHLSSRFRGNHRNCPSRGLHTLPQPSQRPVSSRTTSGLLAASCFTSLTTSRVPLAFSSLGSTPMGNRPYHVAKSTYPPPEKPRDAVSA